MIINHATQDDPWLYFLKSLVTRSDTKMVLISFDGLGDAPYHEGKTALEAAHTPNLDTLASRADLGLADPVGPGITPGSGPGHLAIFGYDPIVWNVGRGVLSALGVDFELESDDIAARGNFCTVDPSTGVILDRRAGRIPTETCERLIKKLQEAIPEIDGVEVILRPEREHRFVLILRGEDLQPGVRDTDPQVTGVKPLSPEAIRPEGERLAEIVAKFIDKAREVLADEEPANMVLLRGFDKKPDIPRFPELYQLRAAGFAAYPMYRGLARLVGMDVYAVEDKISHALAFVQKKWEDYDYFFIHVKKTDSYGEDGNFEGKVKILEETDRYLPMITGLNPDVLVVTGDHSTPALLSGHSWHPVPFLLYSRYTRHDSTARFTEMNCARGSLGRFPLRYGLSMMLAHGRRLKKFGA